MKKLRQHKIFKIVWIVMALHILNFSIDAPDAQDDAIAEDLSYNEIESITEFFAEDILQIKDAFSESDENDQEDNGLIKKITSFEFCKIHHPIDDKIVFYPVEINSIAFLYYKVPSLPVNYIEVFSPPPEA
jgi:hypothetical protein